jgi:hypothetical protein
MVFKIGAKIGIKVKDGSPKSEDGGPNIKQLKLTKNMKQKNQSRLTYNS